ncbi:hypothetical protein FOL47_008939 [Perkinsus chesapeaki]|uniref:MATH domain-containing protein n=1 Tax=Perkinsus chesapeaki TaxID=330153 RepID=A0A7J6N2J2_PERCH|nr:hypothetical protein FOL47_008939 [Perkinsus chesapeaki]
MAGIQQTVAIHAMGALTCDYTGVAADSSMSKSLFEQGQVYRNGLVLYSVTAAVVQVRRLTGFRYPGGGRGFSDFVDRSTLSKENGWLDANDKLVFRATASVVEEDPNPLKPDEHEVRFNGREEYDIGDEFKSPPTWKGNYKFQLAVYPGGIEGEDGKRGLAAYIHLLGKRNDNLPSFLKLRIVLLNSKDNAMSIEWSCTHEFNGSDRQSWGCPHLIDIDELMNKEKGWLHDTGDIIMRATVRPALLEGSNPSKIFIGRDPQHYEAQCYSSDSMQHAETLSPKASDSPASEGRSSEGGERSNGSWVMEDTKVDDHAES